MILIIILYALSGSTFSIGKALLEFFNPIFLISIRMFIAGSILLGIWQYFYKKRRIVQSDVWLFIVVTLIHIFIPYTTEFIALKTISPSSACLLYNLTPFFSAFFSYIIFKEKMTLKKWLGFAIGSFGILFYFHGSIGIDLHSMLPNILMLISVITSSLGWIFVRLLVKNRGYSPLLVNGVAMIASGFLAGIWSYHNEGFNQILLTSGGDTWMYIGSLLSAMILIGNIICYNLYGYLLKKYTATFLSFAGSITPLFAALFEWLFFGTIVPLRFFVAIFIIGVGITIFYQEELKQGYIASS